MHLLFERTFAKDVQHLTDRQTKEKVAALLKALEQQPDFEAVVAQVSNVKKLQGYRNYYRIRLGDFRLGFALDEMPDGPTLRLLRLLHRREIYRYFP